MAAIPSDVARVPHLGRDSLTASASLPLSFGQGQADQFDRGNEIVPMDGVTTIVKVTRVCLCHNRKMRRSARCRCGVISGRNPRIRRSYRDPAGSYFLGRTCKCLQTSSFATPPVGTVQ